ncbi:MAG: peptide chain release factor-like protein [Planctomycetes bacterium]|nr:peptide chain release factor-like protein [Planctomycetota bacterium]
MSAEPNYLDLSDERLVAQCDLHTYRSSGPGGQHRNKVSSAVRLLHRPTGITAHGDDSRSQHQNKRLAISRLRMNIALRIRRPVDPANCTIPAIVRECVFLPKNAGPDSLKRIAIGRKDFRFWPVAAWLLDLLDACQGRLADAAGILGVTSSNLTHVLESDRHLLAATQEIRKRHNCRPIA